MPGTTSNDHYMNVNYYRQIASKSTILKEIDPSLDSSSRNPRKARI